MSLFTGKKNSDLALFSQRKVSTPRNVGAVG